MNSFFLNWHRKLAVADYQAIDVLQLSRQEQPSTDQQNKHSNVAESLL